MQIFDGHGCPVLALAFAANGETFASGSKDGAVGIWSLATSQSISQFRHKNLSDAAATAVAWSADATTVVVGRSSGTIEALRLADNGAARQLHAQQSTAEPITALGFCERDRYLVAARGHPVDVADPGAIVIMQYPTGNHPLSIALTHGAQCLAVRQQTIVYDHARRVVCRQLSSQDARESPPHTKTIRAIALSADAKMIAAADDYAIQLYSTESLQRLQTLIGHKGRVDSLAFSPDGRHLLSGAWDKTVRLWDVDAGRELAAHDWDIGIVRCVAIAPDGLLAAAAGERGTIVLWDIDR